MAKEYNLTQLDPETTFERHVFHRDQFAHFLRWTHVIKLAKIGQNVLDFGCGTGNLAEVMYRNKFKCQTYLGLEYRKQAVDNANEKFKDVPWIQFKQQDLTENFLYDMHWDMIVSFEVIEHVNKKNTDKFLNNIYRHCDSDTVVLISTPIYDEHVGAAQNHIIDGIVQEFTYDELKEAIERNGFIIEEVFGTFASQKDYKPFMNDWQKEMYNHLNKYYDSNLVSNLMAPFFPKQSRNCVWRLRRK